MIRDKTLLSIVPGSTKNSQFCLQLAASVAGFERNWWSDWHEYHLESFYCSVEITEDSIIIGVACDKKMGAQKPESLGV